MKMLDRLLTVDKEDRNTFQIIGWWETRRILYNLIVLICGVVSLLVISAFVDLEPSEDLIEPGAIFGFAILCNLGYTLGWLTEVFNKKDKTYGPTIFKIGLYFTLFWVFLPAVLHIVFWIGRGFEKMT